MEVGAPRLEDRLGPNEPPYKSRGEAQVGRLLDRYGIPFLYESALVLRDRGSCRTWHPDFTLPSYGGLVVEYAGMPDRPDYMAGIVRKQAAYRRNDIPALFLYPRDLTGPTWPQMVVNKVVAAYQRAGSTCDRIGYRFSHRFSRPPTHLQSYSRRRVRYGPN